jgi:2-methylisocitrate lyase-like PEP mutase family enzyme
LLTIRAQGAQGQVVLAPLQTDLKILGDVMNHVSAVGFVISLGIIVDFNTGMGDIGAPRAVNDITKSNIITGLADSFAIFNIWRS